MLNKNNIQLKQKIVQSFHFDFDEEKIRNDSISFEVSGQSELRRPKDQDNPTFLLITSIDIESENCPDALRANIVIKYVFEITEPTDDFDNIIRKQCLPLTQKETNRTINLLFRNMGHPNILEED